MAHNGGVNDPGLILTTGATGQTTNAPFIIWTQMGVGDRPTTRDALNHLDDLQGCRLIIH